MTKKNREEFNLNIRMDLKEKMIYINNYSESNSRSEFAKSFKRKSELKKIISNYLNNYISVDE